MDIWGSEGTDAWRLEDSNNWMVHDLYSSQNIIRVQKSRSLMARDACGGEERSTQGSVGNPQGKRPHERHRRRWYFDIKINLAINMMGAWTGLVWLQEWHTRTW
jgi:hypothetical protein